MTLILCPECSKQISDKAPACPHCGIPAAYFPQSDVNIEVPMINDRVAVFPAQSDAPKSSSLPSPIPSVRNALITFTQDYHRLFAANAYIDYHRAAAFFACRLWTEESL